MEVSQVVESHPASRPLYQWRIIRLHTHRQLLRCLKRVQLLMICVADRLSWNKKKRSWPERNRRCSEQCRDKVSIRSMQAFILYRSKIVRRFLPLTLTFVLVRQNNFPPLPSQCCIQPCFYQDFNVDIPLEFQRIVKIGYYLWMGWQLSLFDFL